MHGEDIEDEGFSNAFAVWALRPKAAHTRNGNGNGRWCCA
jgi:hypothetical protein